MPPSDRPKDKPDPKKRKAPREKSQKSKQTALTPDPKALPDPIALGRVMAEVSERARPLVVSFFEKAFKNPGDRALDPLNMRQVYLDFMNSLMANPARLWELQLEYWQQWFNLVQESTRHFMGEPHKNLYAPERTDRRFREKMWEDSPVFDFIKQSYLLTSRWMQKVVSSTEGLDRATQEKLDFYTRQFADALSPSNFVLTNPEVLKETIDTRGENLVRGLQNLLEDLERGDGELKISTTDYSAFAPGRNLAITPGKIVYENDLMQLIQYTPTTPRVFGRPVLVIPPWINKYYILDMRPDNSFLRWLVAQGHTVFTISWVNPDRHLAKKRFEDYLRDGILKSLDVIGKITGEASCNAVGYCLGGTLLSVALAFLAAKGQSGKIASATFLTTLIDFEESGELKLFIDDDQLALLDREMAEKGVLEARALQKTFSLLRSNDLIWSFVVNNYLMGKEPFPFDLLYWNDDSTNMPAAMHSFYLRKMYRDNLLTVPGGITVDDVPIDLKTIRTPAWFLSTREDHIAPWKATYAGARLLGGPATFTLAASGHIAGVVNPPEGKKYCFWTSGHLPEKPEAWLEKAQEKPGSWWPEWESWLQKFGGDQTDSASRIPGTAPGFKPIEDAPGRYVKVRR
jgi:polyhydroxyalkanoate synthase